MLNGKVALVTGGARGIGKAIAMKLASQGADIAILDAGSLEVTEQTAEELRALGVRAFAARCDITDYDQVTAAVAQVKEALGGVDILVNNAGITRDKLALRMTPEDFDAVLSVNLKGTFLMIKALYADFMKKRAGRIINIASISGLMGNAGQANYSASKAGVVGLTKTIARELAGLAGVDEEELAGAMFEAGENVEGKTAESLFYQDFKRFTNETVSFAVGQGSYVSPTNRQKAEGILRSYMDEALQRERVDMIFYLLTDIKAQQSKVLWAGEDADKYLRRAFDCQEAEGGYILPGVISRKKQFIPPLLAAMQTQEGARFGG